MYVRVQNKISLELNFKKLPKKQNIFSQIHYPNNNTCDSCFLYLFLLIQKSILTIISTVLSSISEFSSNSLFSWCIAVRRPTILSKQQNKRCYAVRNLKAKYRISKKEQFVLRPVGSINAVLLFSLPFLLATFHVTTVWRIGGLLFLQMMFLFPEIVENTAVAKQLKFTTKHRNTKSFVFLSTKQAGKEGKF